MDVLFIKGFKFKVSYYGLWVQMGNYPVLISINDFLRWLTFRVIFP